MKNSYLILAGAVVLLVMVMKKTNAAPATANGANPTDWGVTGGW